MSAAGQCLPTPAAMSALRIFEPDSRQSIGNLGLEHLTTRTGCRPNPSLLEASNEESGEFAVHRHWHGRTYHLIATLASIRIVSDVSYLLLSIVSSTIFLIIKQ
jgi:hypothetical protein